jgi:tetratricopeptide (TPR) repeat protein
MKHNLTLILSFLAALALLVFVEKGARAQGGTKKTEIYPIVVSSQPGYEVQKEIIMKAALTAIAENPKFSYQQGDMTFHNINASSLKIIEEAEALYKEAIAKYDDLDMPGAIQKAEKAMEKLELGVAYVDDMTLAVKILHLIGVCHTLNGDLNASSEAFLRAYSINPNMKLDTNLYPPDVVDVFDAVSQDASQVGTGSISVKSSPKGASVYLDGMPMGVTPVTIDNIIVGKHMVKLSKPGYQYFGSVLNVQAGKVKTLDAKLAEITGVSRVIAETEKIPGLLAKGMDSTLPPMATISKDLGVEQLLVIILSPGEGQVVSLSYYVYDRLKNAYLAQRQGDSPSVNDQVLLPKAGDLAKSTLAAALAKETGEGGTVTKIVTPPVIGPGTEPEKEKKKKKGIVHKWWFWAALIGGAAVVGGAAGLGYAGATGQLGGGGPGGSGGTGDVIIAF